MNNNVKKMTSIGGQAVIEGVMMKGPETIATAVRKADGEIVIDKKSYEPISKKIKIFKLPLLRGVVAFFESMIIGMNTLMQSAEYFDLGMEEEVEPSRFEKWMDKTFGDKMKNVIIGFSVMLSLVFSIGLFVILPNFVAKLTFGKDAIMYNVVEGVIRLVLFFLYIVLISKMKDIQRVFEYHGAEHKSIHCYENGEMLTVENVKKYSVLHPRCGTSFLMFVMLVSIVVFSFFWYPQFWLTITARLLLLPVVAGLSYEIIKFAGKSQSRLVCVLNQPGMWMQNFTTREPDDSQIEVAIKALESVIVEDPEADKW